MDMYSTFPVDGDTHLFPFFIQSISIEGHLDFNTAQMLPLLRNDIIDFVHMNYW